MEFPELDKMAAVHDDSQIIGEFLEWLRFEKKTELCQWEDFDEVHYPIMTRTEELLADYFDIDLDQVERERRELLTYQRGLNVEAGR